MAVRHHYGIPAPDARSGLLDSLTSGLISPLNGQSVILALREEGGAGAVRQADNGRPLALRAGDADLLTAGSRPSGAPVGCKDFLKQSRRDERASSFRAPSLTAPGRAGRPNWSIARSADNG